MDRNTLMEVLGRSQLDPSSELVVFHAARSWAEAVIAYMSVFHQNLLFVIFTKPRILTFFEKVPPPLSWVSGYSTVYTIYLDIILGMRTFENSSNCR